MISVSFLNCLWLCLRVGTFLCQSVCCSVPLISLLCFQGCWCLATAGVIGFPAWSTRMVGASAMSRMSWVTGSVTVGGVGEGSQGAGLLCHVLCCWVHELHHCREGVGVQSLGCLHSWWDRVTGPLPLLPSYLWPWVLLWSGVESHLCCLPCFYWVLWNCGLSHCGKGIGLAGTASTVLPVLTPLCVPAHITLDVQIWRILCHPGVWGRSTFVELWMFYWLYVKRGETKGASPSSMMLMSHPDLHLFK